MSLCCLFYFTKFWREKMMDMMTVHRKIVCLYWSLIWSIKFLTKAFWVLSNLLLTPVTEFDAPKLSSSKNKFHFNVILWPALRPKHYKLYQTWDWELDFSRPCMHSTWEHMLHVISWESYNWREKTDEKREKIHLLK